MSTGSEAAEKVSYSGNCHCNATRFTVTIPSLTTHQVTSCTCSICTKNGYLIVSPRREDVLFHSGYDQLKSYRFNSKKFLHKFCGTCGSSVLVEEGDILALNVRLFKGIELDRLKLWSFDGKNELPDYEV